MWCDQSDHSICNQITIIIYLRIINIRLFFLLSSCSTSAEDLLEKCVQQRWQNNRRTDGKQKEDSSECKKLPDCSFKFKRVVAQTLKIYFEKASGRGNKTIVGTIAIVKQVVLASKSKLAFEFKTRNRKYEIITFRCKNSLYTMLPDPFSCAFRGLGHETTPVWYALETSFSCAHAQGVQQSVLSVCRLLSSWKSPDCHI